MSILGRLMLAGSTDTGAYSKAMPTYVCKLVDTGSLRQKAEARRPGAILSRLPRKAFMHLLYDDDIEHYAESYKAYRPQSIHTRSLLDIV